MEVNYLLKTHAGDKGLEPPKGLLFPPKQLAGKSAETIYEWLLKRRDNNSGNSSGDSDAESCVGSS